MNQYDIVVIGGGPAGLAAAYSAWKSGAERILILERDDITGGILNQCIHNGFGLHYFQEELTGPEYAQRFEDMIADSPVELLTGTMVLEVTRSRVIHALSSTEGYLTVEAGAVILAMGCRERTRGAIMIPGDRPSGVFTAGTAQRYVNMEGYQVGRRCVILGSGDIGLIMARRMALEGAEVLGVVEIMPYSNGLNRNIVQCLHDYDIPLYLSHTVTAIHGRGRLSSVTVSRVDENRRPVPGTEFEFDCDTLLLSVGLIPENELSKSAGIQIDPKSGGAFVFDDMQTSEEGIFACGNVLHVHDLVDFVTEESIRAGKAAAEYIRHGSRRSEKTVAVESGEQVNYVVPQMIDPAAGDADVTLLFRVSRVIRGGAVVVTAESGEELLRKKRRHLLPAEMERLMIPRHLLDHTGSVSVSICQEESSAQERSITNE